MEIQIIRDDIDFALAPSLWDLGNQVLYSLCQDYPKHDQANAIMAKVWLIGRSYAAAIERRKNPESTSDDFYETTVADKIKQSKLDEWLENLPNRMTNPWVDLGPVITAHKQLMNLFFDMTGLENRALASKYLHFHRPDLFFIYDSRAREAVSKVSPRLNQIKEIKASHSDPEYLAFCRRSQWLKENLKARFYEDLTPRQIDKILLRITDKIRKAPTSHSSGQ